MDLVDGHWAVFDAFGDDVELAGVEFDVGGFAGWCAEVDPEGAFEDEEEVVGVGVGVPDEVALELDEHDVVAVEVGDDLWMPAVGEAGELGFEVDGGCGRFHLGATLGRPRARRRPESCQRVGAGVKKLR